MTTKAPAIPRSAEAGPEMAEASERGEVRLGGCIVWDESPDFECGGCGSLLPWVARDDEDDADE